jgi:hypothetical protein
MRKHIYLYAGATLTNVYADCTNVTTKGSILSFTDNMGYQHITSRPWEIVMPKEDRR